MTTGASLLIGASSADLCWDAIDWQTAERSVRRLQVRIAKATRARRWGKVYALQRLLTHSFAAKLLAVRRVVRRYTHELRHRVRSLALERLERCDRKLSRTVLRGGSDRKVAPLPGVRQAWRVAPMTGAGNRKAKADREVTRG